MPCVRKYSNRNLSFAFLVLIVALALGARLLPTPRTIDDAFITFRYARNLLAGLGFVYNPGERVLGTTTPLYTGLVAGLAGLARTSNYPWLALWVNAVADALTCGLLARVGHDLTGRRGVGLAVALLWAVAPMSVTFAIGGMETSVAILLLVATASLFLRGHGRLTAAAAGLALLARPDSALLVLPIALARLIEKRRRLPWAEALVGLAVLAPWLVFAGLYFGSPLPHSIAAKTVAYRLAPEAALVRLLQHYGTPFFEHLALGPVGIALGLVLYPALALIGTLASLRRCPRAWPLFAYPWLYLAVFAAANPLIFRWYLAPPLPFYFLAIVAGAAEVIAKAAQAITRRVAWARPGLSAAGLAALTALWAAFSLKAWTTRLDHGPTHPAPAMAWHQLELLYEGIGRRLAVEAPPGSTVAAGDVGALGYYSGARILDTVGLMSPEAARYYPLPAEHYVINYAIAPQLVLDTLPDYVVLLEVYGRAGLLREPAFQADYRLDWKVPTDIYGSDGLLVFRRRSP
jgi:hypothetical protein